MLASSLLFGPPFSYIVFTHYHSLPTRFRAVVAWAKQQRSSKWINFSPARNRPWAHCTASDGPDSWAYYAAWKGTIFNWNSYDILIIQCICVHVQWMRSLMVHKLWNPPRNFWPTIIWHGPPLQIIDNLPYLHFCSLYRQMIITSFAHWVGNFLRRLNDTFSRKSEKKTNRKTTSISFVLQSDIVFPFLSSFPSTSISSNWGNPEWMRPIELSGRSPSA